MKPDDEQSPTPPETPETPETPDAPFEFGDRTVFTLRAQSFTVDNEYGTMILPASHAPVPLETTEMPLPPMPPLPPLPEAETHEAHAPEVPTDSLLRLEEKIDTALRLIHSLQRQLDSIDAALARSLNR